MRFKRILLKLSGESLMGSQGYGIDPRRLADYAEQIKDIASQGVEISIVIGGGNIFRGLSGASAGFDRVKGDQMGMLATVINSLALSSALESIGQPARVLTAIDMHPVYDEVLSRGLKVMDVTATALARENNMPIYVFNMDVKGNLAKMMAGEPIGTLVHP